MRTILIPIILMFSLLGCGPSTEIVKSWQAPGATVIQTASNKTLVVAMVKDETSRRIIEDELVKRLNCKATASYTMLTPEMVKADSEDILK